MQVTDSDEAPAAPMLQTPVRIPVRLLEGATPADSAGVRALFDSILQWGILQPLIVRRIAGSARYEVLAGCKRLASAVSAGFSDVPCVVFEGSDADAAAIAAASNVSAAAPVVAPAAVPASPLMGAVLAELQAAQKSVAASLRLTQSAGGGFRRRIARELADVELQRAGWIVDGLQILNAEERGNRTLVRLAPLLRSVVDLFQPECRLSGITAQLLVDPVELAVMGNESEVRAAVTCATGATLTAMHNGRQSDGALAFFASETSGAVVLSITQNVVSFQELARIRSGSRRGEAPPAESVLTCFGLDAAQRGVERQGGRLELRPDLSTAAAAIDLKLPPVASTPDRGN